MINDMVMMRVMIIPKRKLLKFVILLSCVIAIGYIFVWAFSEDSKALRTDNRNVPPGEPRTTIAGEAAAKSRDHFSIGSESSYHNGEVETGLISEYCNSPKKHTSGEEGNIPSGYKLRQVHMFTRHGDRTPIRSLPGYALPEFSCKFSSWYNGADPFIKRFPTTLDLMEGMQPKESRFMKWALYPNKGKCSEADLTGRGALQHINLGRHLQRVYMEDHSLIDKKRPFGPQLMVKSTLLSRTYKSAVAFLYGFLPNFNISLVNIESSSNLHFCSKKATYMKSCHCQRAKTYEQQVNRQKQRDNANSFNAYELTEAVARIFDVNTDSLLRLATLADTFTPAYCHNHTKLCSEKNSTKCVDSNLIESIWNEIRNQEINRNPENKSTETRFASLSMYPVLIEIFQRIRDLVEHRFTQRFVMYSGHDVTLQPLLMVLGLHDGKWPPYASRFILETVESIETPGQYYVRFIYNGVDRTKDVVFCRQLTVNGLCPVNQFQKFVFAEMLQRYGYKSISEACGS